MSEFVAFVMIVFVAVWGSVFLGVIAKRFMNQVEAGPDGPLIDDLRDDVTRLADRLAHVEEELTFYRELRGPESPPALGRPDDSPS